MGLFRNQPSYCSVCGKPGEYPMCIDRVVVCSDECAQEARWRTTLYIMGKDYYPSKERR